MNLRIEDYEIPAGKHRCPRCDGTRIIPLTEKEQTYSWNKGKMHRACDNCGAQYMFGRALGYVAANREGNPCLHNYSGKNAGRCLTEYTCKHCGDQYPIDSSD